MTIWLVGKQRKFLCFTLLLMTAWGVFLLFLPGKLFSSWEEFRSASWWEQILYGILPTGVASLHLLAMAVDWRNYFGKLTVDGQGVCAHTFGVCWFYGSWNELEVSLQYAAGYRQDGEWPGEPELVFGLHEENGFPSRIGPLGNGLVIVDFSDDLWRQLQLCHPAVRVGEVNPSQRPPGFRWPR